MKQVQAFVTVKYAFFLFFCTFSSKKFNLCLCRYIIKYLYFVISIQKILVIFANVVFFFLKGEIMYLSILLNAFADVLPCARCGVWGLLKIFMNCLM